MDKTKRLVVIGSMLFSLVIIVGAVMFSTHKKNAGTVATQPQHAVSKSELAKADGKNGHICYVAVDGTVYQIQGFALWENGKHLTSNGQAYCGADMSKVIDKAPHGRKILDILIKVGSLKG